MTTPRPVRSRQDMRAFRPCLACGMPVLSALDAAGRMVHLDARTLCYNVTWAHEAAMPTALEGQAYVVHTCGQERR